MSQKVLSRSDAAKKITISVNTLQRLVKLGNIKQVKLSSRRVGFLESDIEAYLANGGVQ